MLNPVPTPTQTLGQTNLSILNNFTTIDTGFSVDHVTFGAAAVGFHKQVTLPNVSTLVPPTVPTFLAGQMGLFNQSSVATAAPALSAAPRNEIWMSRGTGIPFPITAYDAPNAPADTRGWTYLPSGMLMIWGTASIISAGTSTSVTFTNNAQGGVTSFPGFQSFVGCINMTRIAGGSSQDINGFPVLVSFTKLGFVFESSDSGTANRPFMWMAIGY